MFPIRHRDDAADRPPMSVDEVQTYVTGFLFDVHRRGWLAPFWTMTLPLCAVALFVIARTDSTQQEVVAAASVLAVIGSVGRLLTLGFREDEQPIRNRMLAVRVAALALGAAVAVILL